MYEFIGTETKDPAIEINVKTTNKFLTGNED